MVALGFSSRADSVGSAVAGAFAGAAFPAIELSFLAGAAVSAAFDGCLAAGFVARTSGGGGGGGGGEAASVLYAGAGLGAAPGFAAVGAGVGAIVGAGGGAIVGAGIVVGAALIALDGASLTIEPWPMPLPPLATGWCAPAVIFVGGRAKLSAADSSANAAPASSCASGSVALRFALTLGDLLASRGFRSSLLTLFLSPLLFVAPMPPVKPPDATPTRWSTVPYCDPALPPLVGLAFLSARSLSSRGGVPCATGPAAAASLLPLARPNSVRPTPSADTAEAGGAALSVGVWGFFCAFSAARGVVVASAIATESVGAGLFGLVALRAWESAVPASIVPLRK